MEPVLTQSSQDRLSGSTFGRSQFSEKQPIDLQMQEGVAGGILQGQRTKAMQAQETLLRQKEAKSVHDYQKNELALQRKQVWASQPFPISMVSMFK